jgi:hypothetical protein
MNAHDLLRTHALNDLRRLIPPAHYWMREHEPTADRELTDPLLSHPVRFELAPREHVAARALFDLATYRLRSRAIWSIAFPVRDNDSPTDSPGMTADDEREVTARLEVFRRSALVYARVVGDLHLIECFQPPPPADAAAPMPAATEPPPPRELFTPEWRADLLQEFRDFDGKRPGEPGKKGKHGALAKLARKVGKDDTDVGRWLDKAIEEKRRADAFPQVAGKR